MITYVFQPKNDLLTISISSRTWKESKIDNSDNHVNAHFNKMVDFESLLHVIVSNKQFFQH